MAGVLLRSGGDAVDDPAIFDMNPASTPSLGADPAKDVDNVGEATLAVSVRGDAGAAGLLTSLEDLSRVIGLLIVSLDSS